MSNGLSIILQVHYSNGGQSMMALYINPITTLENQISNDENWYAKQHWEKWRKIVVLPLNQEGQDVL